MPMNNFSEKPKKTAKNKKDNKGFYIALVTGVIILGICSSVGIINIMNPPENGSGNEIQRLSNPTLTPQVNPYSNDEAFDVLKPWVSSPTVAPSDTSTEAVKSTEMPVSAGDISYAEEQVEEEAAEVESADEKAVAGNKIESAPSYKNPHDGNIIVGYSPAELIYSTTMDDYRTHSGVDIEGKLNDKVKAFASGTVTDIYTEGMWGVCIKIDHGSGLISLYANLAEETNVKKGQKVKTGDVIGKIGESALIEIGEKPHLHFEIFKDNKPVNPSDYIKH